MLSKVKFPVLPILVHLFVLPIGVEGLVHISELSDQNVDKVEDVLKLGEKKQFRVINVNRNERRLGLSLRQPREEKKVEVATRDAVRQLKKKLVLPSAPKVEQHFSCKSQRACCRSSLKSMLLVSKEPLCRREPEEDSEQTKDISSYGTNIAIIKPDAVAGKAYG